MKREVRATNKMDRGPSGPLRPTLVAWPPSQMRVEPHFEVSVASECECSPDPLRMRAHAGDSTENTHHSHTEEAEDGKPTIKHKDPTCTSTRWWRHVWGDVYCSDCQPCVDRAALLESGDAANPGTETSESERRDAPHE